MLTISSLTVRYGKTIALDHVDLSLEDHEVVCLLGPSGSGKSTLLRGVSGLLPEIRGSITCDGTDLDGTPPHRRGFGLMFQDHALFPHRDVLGNVAFGLRMQRLSRAAIASRVAETLDLVGLGGFESRRVHELSGGEQQRVALARALAPAPRLLMLDEPLGALDRELRERLAGDLRALFERLRIAILFVTHDHDEALALADRLVLMHDGRVEQVGPPAEVWDRPANEFVARFFGWNITRAFGSGPAAVRPDHLSLDGGSPVRGTVVGRTFRGDHTLVEMRVTGDRGMFETLRVAVVAGAPLPEVGDVVGVTADATRSVALA